MEDAGYEFIFRRLSSKRREYSRSFHFLLPYTRLVFEVVTFVQGSFLKWLPYTRLVFVTNPIAPPPSFESDFVMSFITHSNSIIVSFVPSHTSEGLHGVNKDYRKLQITF